MTDAGGTKVWEIETKPFGEPLSVSGSVTNNLRFPGLIFPRKSGHNEELKHKERQNTKKGKERCQVLTLDIKNGFV